MIAIILSSMINGKGFRLCLWLAIGSCGFLMLSVIPPAAAVSSNISHSYSAAGQITNGDIVSLDLNRSGYVQAANSKNGNRLLGVAESASDSLLAENPSSNKIQVAINGTVSVLVSTVNGSIKVGDMVSVSPFNGIGMESQLGKKVIGLAQTSHNSSTLGSKIETVDASSGKASQVRVGYVQVTISVGTDTAGAGTSLNGLQKFFKKITDKTISTSKLIICCAVIIIVMVALVSLIYSAIYSSIVAIGRNPLAKYAIFRSLGVVVLMAFSIAFTGTAIVYYLLR
jgi:hypothetical protein